MVLVARWRIGPDGCCRRPAALPADRVPTASAVWILAGGYCLALSRRSRTSCFTRGNRNSALAADPANFDHAGRFCPGGPDISRLSSRVTGHAREAESRGGQMHDLYEFTRRTLQMNLHVEPGPQLAELVHEIFALEAVAVFDADLHDVYQAGYWSIDPQEMAQNVYYFETSDDDPEPGLGAAWCGWERSRWAAWWCAAKPAR